MRIAIIGGGIAGLAAAWELERKRAAGQSVSYTLFESLPRLGGSLASEIVNGAVLERGPDSFLTEKPAAASNQDANDFNVQLMILPIISPCNTKSMELIRCHTP